MATMGTPHPKVQVKVPYTVTAFQYTMTVLNMRISKSLTREFKLPPWPFGPSRQVYWEPTHLLGTLYKDTWRPLDKDEHCELFGPYPIYSPK